MAQMVPLDEADVKNLTRLMFEWNCSPQEAVSRALVQALVDEFGERVDGQG